MKVSAMEYLIFEVGGQLHAVPAADVRELLPALAIMPVPGAPRGIEGFINLRGEVLPVVDVRARLGMPSKEIGLADQLIVVQTCERLLVLHVDRAVELAAADAAEVEVGGPGVGRGRRVLKLAGGMVLMHDVHEFAGETAAVSIPVPEGVS